MINASKGNYLKENKTDMSNVLCILHPANNYTY